MMGLNRSVLPSGIWSCCTWSIHGVSAFVKHNTKWSHMANLLSSAKEKHTNKMAHKEPPSPSPSRRAGERLFIKPHRCLYVIIITQSTYRCWWKTERKRGLFFCSPRRGKRRVGGIYMLRVCEGMSCVWWRNAERRVAEWREGLGKEQVELVEG